MSQTYLLHIQSANHIVYKSSLGHRKLPNLYVTIDQAGSHLDKTPVSLRSSEPKWNFKSFLTIWLALQVFKTGFPGPRGSQVPALAQVSSRRFPASPQDFSQGFNLPSCKPTSINDQALSPRQCLQRFSTASCDDQTIISEHPTGNVSDTFFLNGSVFDKIAAELNLKKGVNQTGKLKVRLQRTELDEVVENMQKDKEILVPGESASRLIDIGEAAAKINLAIALEGVTPLLKNIIDLGNILAQVHPYASATWSILTAVYNVAKIAFGRYVHKWAYVGP
ncbi:hypothetical protein C8R45DRAFT_1075194 [Mycena sanguinolenta]|nr:hypothetical protein C8R45DRAFT_1075194 [Mycena sanguinolenta]